MDYLRYVAPGRVDLNRSETTVWIFRICDEVDEQQAARFLSLKAGTLFDRSCWLPVPSSWQIENAVNWADRNIVLPKHQQFPLVI